MIVHRQQLLDQWRERLAMFLELPIGEIGQIGGSKTKRPGLIDVAIVQSLYQDHAVKDFVAEYGHVVVDECHHLSTVTFEKVLAAAKAKYILGLPPVSPDTNCQSTICASEPSVQVHGPRPHGNPILSPLNSRRHSGRHAFAKHKESESMPSFPHWPVLAPHSQLRSAGAMQWRVSFRLRSSPQRKTLHPRR
ncbi:MAG: DEAD/DEAH box helicase family protein [Acidobacteriota bacterium]